MRVLGIENFGIMAMVQAWIQYVIIFVDYGFNFSATLLISVNKDNQSKINHVYTVTTLAKLFLFAISLAILLIYVFIFGVSVYSNLILLGMLSVLGTVLFPVWLFQGLEKMQGIAICTTIAKTISLALIFLLVRSKDDIALAIISQSLGGLFSGIIAYVFIKKYGMAKLTKIKLSDLVESLNNGFDLFVSNITISFYTTLNILIIGYFGGPVLAGYFSAADKLRTAAQGLLSPVQQAMFPRVSSLVADGANLKNILNMYGKKFILYGLAISCGIAIVGYPASLWYYSSAYKISSSILLLMAPTPLIVSIGIVFGQWWLIPNNNTKVVRKTYLLVSICHIVVAISLMKITPIYGVAISVLITEFIVSLIFIKVSYSYERKSK